MTNYTTEADRVAGTLRSAAAWLNLAAERLEAGDLDAAHNMAKLGLYGCEDAPARIDMLHEQEVAA